MTCDVIVWLYDAHDDDDGWGRKLSTSSHADEVPCRAVRTRCTVIMMLLMKTAIRSERMPRDCNTTNNEKASCKWCSATRHGAWIRRKNSYRDHRVVFVFSSPSSTHSRCYQPSATVATCWPGARFTKNLKIILWQCQFTIFFTINLRQSYDSTHDSLKINLKILCKSGGPRLNCHSCRRRR